MTMLRVKGRLGNARVSATWEDGRLVDTPATYELAVENLIRLRRTVRIAGVVEAQATLTETDGLPAVAATLLAPLDDGQLVEGLPAQPVPRDAVA